MELVISIDKDTYIKAKEQGVITDRTVVNAIASGTPLDKIRVEIENHCGLTKENHCRYCSYCNNVMGVREILEIIDKYRTESEVDE